MNKKSQGLSLNTIIIAAIVLIVLVVLWAIFTGRMGGFSKSLNDCESRGGYPQEIPCDDSVFINYPGTSSKYCCIEGFKGKVSNAIVEGSFEDENFE